MLAHVGWLPVEEVAALLLPSAGLAWQSVRLLVSRRRLGANAAQSVRRPTEAT